MSDTSTHTPAHLNLLNRFKFSGGDRAVIFVGSAFASLTFLAATGGAFFEPVIAWRNNWMPDTTMVRVGLVMWSAALGFGIGWFLSGKNKALRAILGGLVLGAMTFLLFADQATLGWGSATILSIAAFAAGIGVWLRNVGKIFAKRPTTFGSAKWADADELETKELIGKSGVRLGAYLSGVSHLPLHYTGDQHGVIAGAARSHKGTSFIIPNLLSYRGPTVTIDIKGENARTTADHLESMGHNVLVVDPYSITDLKVARLNSLDFIIAGGVESGDNAMILAAALIKSNGGQEKFWDEEARALIAGIMLHVALDPSEDGHRHLARVRDLLLFEGDDLTALFECMRKSAHPIVRSTANRSLQKEEKLLANVLASAQSHTHFLDSPALRENLSASDFRYEDLKGSKMSIFLVLPADKLESHAAWLRLHIQQSLTVNARNIEQKPEKPILFILDEMPALGRLPMVETAFGLIAGYGMQLIAICQSASQLKNIYQDNWETFISNAGFIQYLGSQDEFTSEYFSKLCGVATVPNLSSSIAKAFSQTFGQNGSTSQSETTTDSLASVQRRLAYADELRRMDEDQQLVLVRNCNPIIAQKQNWFEHPELKDLGVNLHTVQAEANAMLNEAVIQTKAEAAE